MEEHHDENSMHEREDGKPADRKQDVTCNSQALTAVKHEGWSENSGIGVEHQDPHLYSQVGVGLMVVL